MNKPALKIWLFLAGLTVILPAAPGQSTIRVDGVAAHVNDEIITIGEVVAVVDRLRPRLMSNYGGDELKRKLEQAYWQALDSLIDRQLVLDAYEEGDARLPESVVDERVEQHVLDNFKGDRRALLEKLQDSETGFDDWREGFRNQILLSLMKSKHVDQKISVSPREVADVYNEDPDKYRSPARYRVRMITVQAKGDEMAAARERAEQALARIAGGESFAEVARTVSDGKRARDGGDWGWVSAEMLRPVLRTEIEKLAPGENSSIIHVSGEFFIIRLEDRVEAGVTPFEQVHPEIERELRMREAAALYDAWLKRLRDAAYVKIFDVSL